MKDITRLGLLSLSVALGIVAVTLTAGGLSTAAAADPIDLTVEMQAPAHIASGSTYVVRTAYYNFGTAMPPDAWVTITLPAGTHLISATNRWGTPLPPDETDGNELTWYFVNPHCRAPLDANCGHILLTLRADQSLQEGAALTTTAAVATTAVESNTANNSASVSSIVCAMAGSNKQAHASLVMPGDVLTYTIRVSYRPGAGVSGPWVTVTDTLPLSHMVRFLGWAGTLTGTVHDGHKLMWQGSVEAGEPVSLQFRVGVNAITPGIPITNVAGLAWGGRHLQLGPISTVITMPHDGFALGPNHAGHLWHRQGVTLSVPPGSVTDTTRFQFGPLFTDTRPISAPPGLLFAHRAFELAAYRFGQVVHRFGQPLTITVAYSDTDVAGLKRETLRLWTRSGPEGPWARLGEPARVMSGALAFTTTHFSQFALFGEGNCRGYLPLAVR
jgi:uncharacterized repeat protein (TIGR01451 family)